jgi:hypothetical protein
MALCSIPVQIIQPQSVCRRAGVPDSYRSQFLYGDPLCLFAGQGGLKRIHQSSEFTTLHLNGEHSETSKQIGAGSCSSGKKDSAPTLIECA